MNKLSKIILDERYLQQGEKIWEDICKRMSSTVAKQEQKYDFWENLFYTELEKMNFIPGGRIISNIGKQKSHCMNCNTVDVEDNRESIGEMLKDILIVSGTGGGVGVSFSKVRYKGAPIKTVGGESSGSISFMKCADQVAGTIKTGGGRRAALMISLSVYHPDIMEFLHEKLDLKTLSNANISVEIDNKFIQAVRDDSDWNLLWAGKVIKTLKAKDIWNKIITNAHACGEPGILNLGHAREMSNSEYFASVVTTNPCGEIFMPPYGSCCLGSINISNFCNDGKFDKKGFEQAISVGVRFLDDIITINDFPLEKIKQTSTSDRRIGLGLMGLHYAMLKMGIKYSSSQGIEFTEKIYEILRNHSYWTSTELAKEKGSFEKFDPEKFIRSSFVKRLPTKIREKIRLDGIRNVALNTNAPTGTTSILAGVSSGIEPIFSPVYERRYNSGEEIKTEIIADSLFEKYKEENRDISHFEGAHDISPEWHIQIQEAAQYFLDNSVSKTINLPEDYPIDKLSELVLKYIPRLKGITFYREGSRGESPLKPVKAKEFKNRVKEAEDVALDVICPTGTCNL